MFLMVFLDKFDNFSGGMVDTGSGDSRSLVVPALSDDPTCASRLVREPSFSGAVVLLGIKVVKSVIRKILPSASSFDVITKRLHSGKHNARLTIPQVFSSLSALFF